MSDAPYLQDIDSDLNDIGTWLDRDESIMRRRRGERPKQKNSPYRNAPNTVVPIIDDNVRGKSDQEISMILNANRFANFIPNGNIPGTDQSIPQQDITMAANAFNTFLRYGCNYRPKKEEAVDTKNCRGFAISKLITEEHPDWGTIPSFETVDPRDLIVPSDTNDIQKAERVCNIIRMSVRDLKDRVESAGYNKKAVDAVINAIATPTKDGGMEVSESNNDTNSVFRITKTLTGLNKSTNKEVVIWEIGHYATKWDTDNSDAVKEGDKCVSWICPDVPDQLLKIIPWREDDIIDIGDVLDDLGELIDLEEIRTDGKDKPWPYVQHRYEYRTRLWYDSRGLGHLNNDAQIKATAVENGKLVLLDYAMKPLFQSDGDDNKQNVSVRPGVILPKGVVPVQQSTNMIQQLNFEADAIVRDAGQRAGAGSGTYSANVNESRKLQKSATEVVSDNASQDLVSSASVDRFNDADRELFRQLWSEMRIMKVRLPIIVNGEFQGFINERIYSYDFLIEPAASQKTLNPASQFARARDIVDMVTDGAPVTGADIAAAHEYIVNMADPNLANVIFGGGEEGELPITTTLNEQQQQMDEMAAQIEQLTAQTEQANARASAAIDLSKDVADELIQQ